MERLEQAQKHEPMAHLKAAVFVRPTRENFDLLRRELAAPRYSEVWVVVGCEVAVSPGKCARVQCCGAVL